MIRATILLTFKDGRSFNYANKYLVEKTGTDGYKYGDEDRSTPLMSGIPGTCYYYTGLGTDKRANQSGLGKAVGDYEKLKGQIGKTGTVKFPEADSGHGDTDVIIRSYGEIINNDIAEDSFTFNAGDLVSVDLIETWITYPGDDLDRESRDSFPKNSPNYKGWQESKETPNKTVYDRALGADFEKEIGSVSFIEKDSGKKYFVEKNGHVPYPIISLGRKNEISIENENRFKKVITKVDEYGVEAYGIVDVVEKQTIGGIDKKTSKWVEEEKYVSIGETYSGIVYKEFHRPIYEIKRNLNYISAPAVDTLYAGKDLDIDYGKEPTRENYKFIKWSIDEAGKDPAPIKATADITVFAIWEEIKKDPIPVPPSNDPVQPIQEKTIKEEVQPIQEKPPVQPTVLKTTSRRSTKKTIK